jgi:hypothetical protein
MSTVGETRVIPEWLNQTCARLWSLFAIYTMDKVQKDSARPV